MGVTVLGIQHRIGEYQGVHYDNYNLHCVEEVSGDTWHRGSRITYVEISIHALLAESDSKSAQNSGALLRI